MTRVDPSQLLLRPNFFFLGWIDVQCSLYRQSFPLVAVKISFKIFLSYADTEVSITNRTLNCNQFEHLSTINCMNGYHQTGDFGTHQTFRQLVKHLGRFVTEVGSAHINESREPQHTTYNIQHTTYNNIQHTTYNIQHTTYRRCPLFANQQIQEMRIVLFFDSRVIESVNATHISIHFIHSMVLIVLDQKM